MSSNFDKYSVYRDTSSNKLHMKQFTEDFELARDNIIDWLKNIRNDCIDDGILVGLTGSGVGTTQLDISIGYFNQLGIRSGINAIHNEDTSSLADNTYYVYVDTTETRKTISVPQDPVEATHPYIENEASFTVSTNNGLGGIKVCSFVISGGSGQIASIDNDTFRDNAKISFVDDTSYTTYNLLSSKKIVDLILSQPVKLAPVIDQINTPPGSPSDGDRYLVDSSPTGDWAGFSGYIAEWSTELDPDSWYFTSPVEGYMVYVQDINYFYVYNGSSWVSLESLLDFDSIPDGSVYSKIEGNVASLLNDYTASNENKLLIHDGLSSKYWDFIGYNNFSQENEILESRYTNEIGVSKGQMSYHIRGLPSDISVVYSGSRTSYGAEGYAISNSSGISNPTEEWKSSKIPAFQYESFQIDLYATSNNSGNTFDFAMKVYDRGNTLLETIISDTQTIQTSTSKHVFNKSSSSSIIGTFAPTNSSVAYVVFYLRVRNYTATHELYLSPPVVRRMTKNGSEYYFEVYNNNTVGGWSTSNMYVNLDNFLTGITYNTSSDYLNLSISPAFNSNPEFRVFAYPKIRLGTLTLREGRLFAVSVSSYDVTSQNAFMSQATPDNIFLSFTRSGGSVIDYEYTGTADDLNIIGVSVKRRDFN